MNYLQIYQLATKRLNDPIDITVEPDYDGYIARTSFSPLLYGYGKTYTEAIMNLKIDIENLYFELMEDDNFTEDWLIIKNYLSLMVGSDI